MQKANFAIRHERADDATALSKLSAEAFGPGRFVRTAYRIRESGASFVAPSWVVEREGEVIGGIRFTAIAVGDKAEALLLGPLVVDPAHTGRGIGSALIQQGLDEAVRQGYRLVLLVGDLPYYRRFGFTAVPPGQITLPGPVDPARLLARELTPGTLQGYRGRVIGVRISDPRGTR